MTILLAEILRLRALLTAANKRVDKTRKRAEMWKGRAYRGEIEARRWKKRAELWKLRALAQTKFQRW